MKMVLMKRSFLCTKWATDLDFKTLKAQKSLQGMKKKWKWKSTKRKMREWRKKKDWQSFEFLCCLDQGEIFVE